MMLKTAMIIKATIFTNLKFTTKYHSLWI